MPSSKNTRRRAAYAREDRDEFNALEVHEPARLPPDQNRDGLIGESSQMGYRSQGRNRLEQLDTFYDQSLLTAVDRVIKIGKEASAYLCRASDLLGGGYVVAKVYRDRQYRFKNDAIYQEGRERVLGGRMRRALNGKTGFGQELQTGLWVNHEWETLSALHNAGVNVPKPLACAEDAILMQYFGEEDEAAPQLNQLRPEPGEAQRLFDAILRDIETMLACDVVHGDLSPHNILVWQGTPVIIDFPQAVDPRFNSRARDLFRRDMDNVCHYFNRWGIAADAWAITNDLWTRYELGEL